MAKIVEYTSKIAGDKEKLSTLRMLKGAMQLEEINKKGELDDTEIINLISKQIKIRNSVLQ